MKNNHQITHKKIAIDNVEIFYREAGTTNKETILFLHGFPSSSFQYRNVMADLAERFHVIAPDYPGFGYSSALPTTQFEYTFDNIALVMERFIDVIGIGKFNLYMHDYGAPIGFRIATKRPELIKSLLIQNANAYVEGLGPDVQIIGVLQAAGDEQKLDDAINHKVSLESMKAVYLHGAEDLTKISPEAYLVDASFMESEHIKSIQRTLFKNYGSNFPKYPEWQNYFRQHQPKALIMWGKNDRIFIAPGAEAYKRDLPNAELHMLNTGHFALEEHHLTVAALISDFLGSKN